MVGYNTGSAAGSAQRYPTAAHQTAAQQQSTWQQQTAGWAQTPADSAVTAAHVANQQQQQFSDLNSIYSGYQQQS